jgi:nucleoside-diphosphate-sugar epimerase
MGIKSLGLIPGSIVKQKYVMMGRANPRTISKGVRQIDMEDLRDIEAIVHMGELSNDPLGQMSPDITYEINHQASVQLVRLAREAGVRRFVYMSSCSVYGVSDADCVDEKSPVDPQTALESVHPVGGAA